MFRLKMIGTTDDIVRDFMAVIERLRSHAERCDRHADRIGDIGRELLVEASDTQLEATRARDVAARIEEMV